MIQAAGLNKNKTTYFTAAKGRVMYYHSAIYLIKGEGFFEDETTPYTRITPGTAFYLYPDIWHHFDPKPGTKWNEYWVTFDGTIAKTKFGDLIPPPRKPVFYIGMDDRIIEAYEALYNAWYFKTPGHEVQSVFLLHEILARMHMKINRIPMTRTKSPVERVKTYMRENINALRIDYDALAAQEEMNYEQLRKSFRAETGIPLTTYFLMLKLNRAKELLLNSDATVGDVAKRCGFAGQYYFSRFFKEKEGVSPQQFRKNNFILRAR